MFVHEESLQCIHIDAIAETILDQYLDELDGVESAECDKPPPEQQEDLLVVHVDREHTLQFG